MTCKRVLFFTSKLDRETRGFEEAAEKWNVELIYVTDQGRESERLSESRMICTHFEIPESAAYTVLEEMKHTSISGILALENLPAVVAAYAARGLGIPYNHPMAVEACRSRLRMYEIFRDAGLLTPWFRKVPVTPKPEPALLSITYPCVLQPVAPSMGRLAIRANNREEFLVAVDRIQAHFESEEIRTIHKVNHRDMIVEEYVSGEIIAVEGLLVDGELRVLAAFDKHNPDLGTHLEDTTSLTAARHSRESNAAIERCMLSAVSAVGLSHGPVHAEFRLNQNGVWPLRVAIGLVNGLSARGPRLEPDANGRGAGVEELLLRCAANL